MASVVTELTGVKLGFVDQCEPELLTSPFFPSKVGGRPAWLSYESIPAPTCASCSEPLVFLLQLYRGNVVLDSRTYHRMLFIFTCRAEDCQKSGFSHGHQAWRALLPVDNEWYAECVPDLDCKDATFKVAPTAHLCAVCGAAGAKQCSKCKAARYCHRTHQAWHWKNGHKAQCGADVGGSEIEAGAVASPWCLPELELILDEEELPSAIEASQDDRMERFEAAAEELGVDTTPDASINDIERDLNKDSDMNAFKRRTKIEPGQVVRLHEEGVEESPLWIGRRQPVKGEVDRCRHCGGPTRFELQVTPQLLAYLQDEGAELGELDFGVLALYTCTANCDPDTPYQRQQLFHNPVNPKKEITLMHPED